MDYLLSIIPTPSIQRRSKAMEIKVVDPEILANQEYVQTTDPRIFISPAPHGNVVVLDRDAAYLISIK